MKFHLRLICLTYLTTTLGLHAPTTKRTPDEDYYYDYDSNPSNNMNNNISKVQFKPESLILPQPDTNTNYHHKYSVDVLPDVELPDDSLADTDLRDHDFIDNLMYVYYGSHNKNVSNYGQEIIIVGSVLSCAAQLLTIFIVLLKKNFNGKRDVNCIFLQLMGCFCLSNLIFMMGVYSTRNAIKCQIIGVTLYYLHLLTAFWLFMFVYYIYKKFCNADILKMQIFYSVAYGAPALLTMISILISPRSFETKRFCFISVQKGMIVNYMMPVSLLIISTTVYCLNGIRKINMELSKLELTSSAESLNALKHEIEGTDDKNCPDGEIISLRESKRCLKTLCIVQTSYDIVWFVAVLALENINYSNSMSIVYSITSCLLTWYIFARTKTFLPTIMSNRLKLVEDCVPDQIKVHSANTMIISHRGSSDSVPLLVSSETEMRELVRHDYISTISN
ncbi:uncharacterized protein [Atheta coriaria]|uniref:uncharacterized protein isoform X2 n=1 Tax=Dalotia coriaria TaxID=877792 RepID=UPI0031F3DD4D